MVNNQKLEKGTHVELFQPVVKSKDGKYSAILSADSVDRDGDIVSDKALDMVGNDKNYTAILMNHENDIRMQIGEWTNKRVEKVGGLSVLVAEPKFYLSNPNAQLVKGMLDEGAEMGISIGAIVKEHSDRMDKSGNWCGYVYDEIELLEASFVAIPSNRHGRATAVAKMLSGKKTVEVKKKMSEEKMFTQKEFDVKAKEFEALEKSLTEEKKSFEEFKVESEKSFKAKEEELEKAVKEVADSVVKFEEQGVELKKLADMSVYKAKFEELQKANEEGSESEEAKKSLSAGMIPVMNK